jgi:hypothetical protein
MFDKKNIWLLFIVSQPGKSQTPRIRLWRALKSLGVAVLRDGVYLLPQREALRTALEEQAHTIRELGGTAYLLEVETHTREESTAFLTLFDRGADYAELLKGVRQRQTELPTWNEPRAQRALQQLRRDLDAIRGIDYFPDSGLTQSEQAVAEVEWAIQQRFSPHEPHPASAAIEPCHTADFEGCTWATRAQLWVDRVACAWLIRRFIDPEARFIWLKTPADCPPDAVGFDFDNARFTHIGEGVTFEVFLASFELTSDVALARLGTLVHYLDVGGIPVPEAAGFEAILSGVRERNPDDDAVLDTMMPVLDALYTRFGQADV